MDHPPHLGFRDELLADGTVHRRYEDGRAEWRRRGPDGQVHWHDNQGRAGTDEPLGPDLVKRRHQDGSVRYGRDIGYGRTVWGHGDLVTVNRAAFSGRLGRALGLLGVGTVTAVAASQLAPTALGEAEEEQLRRQARERAADSGGDGGGPDGSYESFDSPDDGTDHNGDFDGDSFADGGDFADGFDDFG